jgi:HD-like signal output (HDOD) protein
MTAIFDPTRLPTPPAVALQVVNAASKPDSDPAEIVKLLNLDPALCGKLLKAVNSCLYGLKNPVSSITRAVHVLGLNTVRSLSLGLSLPAIKVGRGMEKSMREYWMTSVSGAIIARELATHIRRTCVDDDLVAGLLRDLGELLIRQTFPTVWQSHVSRHGAKLVEDPCTAELDTFGIDHTEITAELLTNWKLPIELVEPIRYHHQPALLANAGKAFQTRAELLYLASLLAELDLVAQNPKLLEVVLELARTRFNLPREALVPFLQQISPKVEAFASVLNQDIGECPDFAAILSAGATELVNLTVENSRNKLSGSIGVPAPRTVAATHAEQLTKTMLAPECALPPASHCDSPLPEFRPEFAQELPECGCKLGSYELRSLLGRGAMGVVFKAFEPSLNRYVAVKMLAPELAASPNARQRFAREARVAGSIQHENVVGIYAVRESAGTCYLAMEYVRGCSLEDRIEQHGPMPVMLLTSTAKQIVAGLAAAHNKQIIHRDMKPANILIEEETGRAKLTDFGLARVSDDAKMTADGAVIGTPFFMAPETIQGEPASVQSDLFSLGGVLYVMATGKVPFKGQTVAAVFNAVCSQEPIPPRQVRNGVPEWLNSLILNLLCKNPEERPANAMNVAAILSEHQ